MGFLDEVSGQAEALRDLIKFYRDEGDSILFDAQRMASKPPRSFVFTGMGTSDLVSEEISCYLGDRSPAPVVRWEAGELLHYGLKTIRDNDIIITISQSGESVETRRIAESLRHHTNLVGITNNPESTIARLSKIHLPMTAGEEVTVSNRTYTNTLGLLLLLSRAFALQDWTPVFGSLEKAADFIEDYLSAEKSEIERAADFVRDARMIYYVSRGPALVAARWGALVLMEGSRADSTAMPGGSMRHGPYEAIADGSYAMLFAADDKCGDLVREMAAEMADMGCRIILFTSSDAAESKNLITVKIASGDPELFALYCALPQEFLLERMARDRGCEPGVFRYGSKVTLKE